MRTKYLLITCFFIFLLFINIGSASAALAEGTETQITSNKADQGNSAIYGNIIVWVDSRNGDSSGNTDIYAYNISSGEEMRITSNKSLKFSPVIYEDRIAWEDFRNGNWDIYVYNLSTSREVQITLNESDQYSPVLYEDKLVWLDGRNGGGSLDVDHWPEGNWDVYMYNLSTASGVRITTNESWKTSPVIYNDKILWIDGRNGEPLYSHNIVEGDIYLYNLSTPGVTPLVSNVSSDARVDLYKNKLVWDDRRDEDSDIYMYDLVNSSEVQITDNKSEQWYPSIYEDKIIWTDYRNSETQDNPEVYMYDLSASKEMQVTSNEYGQWANDLYGDDIVWTDSRNGNYDIYMFTLADSEKEAVEPEEEPVEEKYTETNAEKELKLLKAHINSAELEPEVKEVLNKKLQHAIEDLSAGKVEIVQIELDNYIELVYVMKERGKMEGIEADYIIRHAQGISESLK